jgi:hypothetical protein
MITSNMSRTERAEFDAMLAGPEKREEARDRMNAESMTTLGVGLVAPPPPRKKSAAK